jgi:hypothetical protein
MKHFIKSISFFIVMSAFLISCGMVDATTFNDQVVNLQQDLLKELNFTKSDSLSDLAYFKLLKEKVITKTKLLNAIKAPEDGEALKTAMATNFGYLEKIYDLGIKGQAENLSTADANKIEKQKEELEKLMDTQENIVLDEQKKFAKSHNFQVR